MWVLLLFFVGYRMGVPARQAAFGSVHFSHSGIPDFVFGAQSLFCGSQEDGRRRIILGQHRWSGPSLAHPCVLNRARSGCTTIAKEACSLAQIRRAAFHGVGSGVCSELFGSLFLAAFP